MKEQHTSPKKEPKKEKNFYHHFITALSILVVIVGIGGGIYFFTFYHDHEETNDAQIEQYVTPVISRITGYIQAVRFQENQFVHKGDTLVVIDNREFKSKLDMAVADLSSAKQSVHVMERGVITSKSNTAIHKAQIDAAQAQLWKAEQDYKRYDNLVKEEAATEQQFEQMKANYESAKAHYNELVNSLAATNLSTEEASSKVDPVVSSVQAKQAAVDNAALFYSYTVITAPYDGWVGRKTIQPGQLVKEGQTLVSVVSKEKWVTANFKETQVQQLAEGNDVVIKADATGNKIFRGKVESLSPASGARFSLLPPDNATGNFVKIEQRIPVRIQLTGNEKETAFLRAGMNVIVTVKNNDKVSR
ncbi:HlyD family secretion protein [Danxiaibacter flavus]|uniref:HlyD family secretion protein n=1 Tax=Danxiaibacter flavus TaxID=3049108 RepID=A0ABV3ZCI0_9BACT|nr:HlyD family secretion protein [Chitinophagaceae bacterium DXS]